MRWRLPLRASLPSPADAAHASAGAFRCNLCGSANRVAPAHIDREIPSCASDALRLDQREGRFEGCDAFGIAWPEPWSVPIVACAP